MTNDIAVPVSGQQAMAELGARANHVGFTPDQVRGLVAFIQELGTTVAFATVPDLLSKLGTINQARFLDLGDKVQRMQGIGPYVRRDAVLGLIQEAMLTNTPVK